MFSRQSAASPDSVRARKRWRRWLELKQMLFGISFRAPPAQPALPDEGCVCVMCVRCVWWAAPTLALAPGGDGAFARCTESLELCFELFWSARVTRLVSRAGVVCRSDPLAILL